MLNSGCELCRSWRLSKELESDAGPAVAAPLSLETVSNRDDAVAAMQTAVAGSRPVTASPANQDIVLDAATVGSEAEARPDAC